MLEEQDAVPISPAYGVSQSAPHFNYSQSSLKRHHFNVVASATDFIFHRSDPEDDVVFPGPLDLIHRAYSPGKSNFLRPRVFPESAAAPGLKFFTDSQFDSLGRRPFSAYTRVLFGPAQSAASKASLKPYQEEEDEVQKKRKSDASADDCDQAVVGLSSASAKAKQKQEEELAKKNDGIVKKVWSTLLGIGPALRAVAAMSR